MSGYIGKVKVDGNDPVLIGSTLYGVCSTGANTAAKTVILSDFNTPPLPGLTIHVKFTGGNTVTSDITLTIGNQTAVSVIGNCVCAAGDIIAFTYEEPNALTKQWVANHSILVEEGTTNGQIKIAGQAVSVHGLGDAAYKGILDTDIAGNSSSTAVPTVAAVAAYVTASTGGLSGLTGAMHFRGITSSEPSGTTIPSDISAYNSTSPEPGDVVVYGKTIDNNTVYVEYVWVNNTVGWELLGDQGSYAYDNAVIHNSLLTSAGDIIYAYGSSATPTRLAGNTTNTKNFLSMTSSVPSWTTLSNTDVGLGNVDNIKQIPFSTASASGDIIYYNGSSYTNLGIGSEGQVLTVSSSNVPVWSANIATDEKTKQSPYSTTANSSTVFNLLFKHSVGDTEETNSVYYSTLSGKKLTYDVYDGTLSAPKFSGDGSSLTNVVASSVSWANITNKITAATNILGLVKTTSTINDATGYTAAPIIDGTVYYKDTHYTSSGSINALTGINLIYNDGTAQTDTVGNSSATATAVGAVSLGVLYIKSMYYDTNSASTGVTIDNT